MPDIYSCPFCIDDYVDEDQFFNHVHGHKITDATLRIVIKGQTLMMNRLPGSANMYKCGSCGGLGPAATMYFHLMADHLDIVRHGSKENVDPRPAKKPRMMKSVPSPPSSSPSTVFERSSLSSTPASSQPRPLSSSTTLATQPRHSNTHKDTKIDRKITTPDTRVAPANMKPSAVTSRAPTASSHPTSASSHATTTVHGTSLTIANELKKLKGNTTVVGLQLNGEDIFGAEFDSTPKIFESLAAAMTNVVDSCPLHAILLPNENALHKLAFQCDLMPGRKDGHFRTIFCRALNCPQYAVCYKCWTPMQTSVRDFDHRMPCTDRASWEGWWRTVPYLAWRVPEIRDKVFPAMGIPVEHFEETLDYARWLAMPCHFKRWTRKSDAVTNLLAMVFVFFRLYDDGKLVPPEGGYKMEFPPPITTSTDERFNNNGGCRY